MSGLVESLDDASARAPTLTAPHGGPRKAPMFRPNQRVGQFTVLSVLGQGGFGQVFEAWDEHLQRRVALKVLFSSTEEEQRLRFERED